MIIRAGTKVGSSDPLFLFGLDSDNKLSYNRDNRVIFPSSSYLWKCLPPQYLGALVLYGIGSELAICWNI
jgi:hypothetical protein